MHPVFRLVHHFSAIIDIKDLTFKNAKFHREELLSAAPTTLQEDDRHGLGSREMPDRHPSLTKEGKNRIQAIVSQYKEDRDLFQDLLKDILGAKTDFGKTHTFLFPRNLRGVDLVTGGTAEKYVLKVCYSHLRGKPHDCRLEEEAWVWEEAVRRGDDHLFAPIAEIDREVGWSVMAYGCYLGDLDRTPSSPFASDGIDTQELADWLERDLRDRGWIPYDTERRAIDEEPVIIDYEKAYPEDMFHGLYINSFSSFYEHDLYPRDLLKEARRRSQPDFRTKKRKERIFGDNHKNDNKEKMLEQLAQKSKEKDE